MVSTFSGASSALVLLALLAAPAGAATVKRFSDAQCTGLVGSYQIFGRRCYGNSMQHGASAADWALTIGTAPIVASWAVQTCVPGSITVARYDTPAGASDFCAGSATSTVTLTKNVCVRDALGAQNVDAPFSMLVDDTCLTDPVANPFLIANMFYGPSCALSQYVFRSTYSVNEPGKCDVVQVPQFLDGSPTARATLSYSTLFGGGYKLSWFSASDQSCAQSSIKQVFTNLAIGGCSSIYGGQGSVQLYVPPLDFPTDVTLGTPSPSPSASSVAVVRNGVLSGGAGSSSSSDGGGGGGAGLAGLAALAVIPAGVAVWYFFFKGKMRAGPRRKAADAPADLASANPIHSAV